MAYHRGYEVAKLVIENNCQKVAEIGIYNGRGMRKTLRNEKANEIIKEYWAIDPYKPLTHYLDMGKQFRSMGRHGEDHWKIIYLKALSYTPFFPQLKVIKLTSEEAVTLFPKRYFPDGYFDLVFIDAEHSYEGVKQDIQLWKPLLKSKGILCGHDYHGQYGARYPGVKQAVDELLGEENIKELPDCVWLYTKGNE